MHTRESLELVKKQDGHAGLKQIGDLYQVKSTGSESLITKILEAQNMQPKPSTSGSPVELLNMDDLLKRARNTEVPWDDPGAYFPALVPEEKMEDVEKALISFAHQWNVTRMEFFNKFQAFRIYIDGKHVDWIGLNEVVRRYELKIPLAARTIARRLYTAPSQRAYR